MMRPTINESPTVYGKKICGDDSKLFAFSSITRNKNRMKILVAIVYRLADRFFKFKLVKNFNF
jgi:hypothetical protein